MRDTQTTQGPKSRHKDVFEMSLANMSLKRFFNVFMFLVSRFKTSCCLGKFDEQFVKSLN